MSAKHTPGPWEAKSTGPWDGWDGWSVEDAAGSVVCDAHGSQTDGTRKANARLIAAAPDLLAACKVAFDQTCSVGRRKDWEQLRTAIAKAEGRAG